MTNNISTTNTIVAEAKQKQTYIANPYRTCIGIKFVFNRRGAYKTHFCYTVESHVCKRNYLPSAGNSKLYNFQKVFKYTIHSRSIKVISQIGMAEVERRGWSAHSTSQG